MNFVRFKRLNHEANLPVEIENGSIYFVKDTNKIYADFNNERTAYSTSAADISEDVTEIVDDCLQDIKDSLDAIEATLDEDVDDNYQELKDNLRVIGQYSTTAEVQAMIAGTRDAVTRSYGTVENGVIKLDSQHSIYKIDTSDRTNYDIDVTALNASNKVIKFELLVENGNTDAPVFLFQPTTLDTARPLGYNYKYTLLEIMGIRGTNDIMWTLAYKGGWTS